MGVDGRLWKEVSSSCGNWLYLFRTAKSAGKANTNRVKSYAKQAEVEKTPHFPIAVILRFFMQDYFR